MKPWLSLLLATQISVAGSMKAASSTPPAARMSRDNLLQWRDEGKVVHPVRTVVDWQKRRAEILKGMQSVMGALPGAGKRCALDVKIEEEVDCGAYVRRLITYQAEPNGRAIAYLCIPKEVLGTSGPCPGVLCLHGTNDKIGHGSVIEGISETVNRQYATELARRGYVTVAPNYPHLARYRPDLKALGYESGTMKAIWDNMRALDLLDTLPFVRHGKYGAIGHSLGGHNAVYTAVFDERIAAVVSSCGLDSYLDYYGGDPKRWQPGQGWCQMRYMPRLASYAGRLAEIPFDFHELIGALAPRHVFLAAPLRDTNFQWKSVDRIAAAASQVYRLYGTPGNLRVEHPDGPHDFPDAMRHIAYQIFDRVLK